MAAMDSAKFAEERFANKKIVGRMNMDQVFTSESTFAFVNETYCI